MEQTTDLEDLYSGSGVALCHRFRRDLGLLLIEEREKRNLTREELSNRLTIKNEIVNNLETGNNKTNWAALCRVLDYYDKWLTVQLVDLDYPKHWL